MVNLVNNRYHRTIWRWMTSILGRCLACLRWIICRPHPWGGWIMSLWQLTLLHRPPLTCWLAKGDVKLAFRVVPIIFKHLRCLGIYFDEEYYVDWALPFGSSIICAIFEEIARLVHWIFEQRSAVHFVHYLDDFLWVHTNFIVCLNTTTVVKETSAEIGLPLAPEKFVELTQSLTFLGLVLNSVCMAIAIPKDKQERIEKQLLEVIQSKKTTVKKIQALAGGLSFITRAVPHGRPFMQKMYDLVAGLKPNWHISVTSKVKRDCHMWLHFIRDYGGWTQIRTPQTPMVLLYTDAAKMADLGWGAWWDTHWTWHQWDYEFI